MDNNKIDECKRKIRSIELQIDNQKKMLRDLISSEEKRQSYKIQEKDNINDIKVVTNDINMLRKIYSMEEELMKKNAEDTMNFEIKKDKIIYKIQDLEKNKEDYQEMLKQLYSNK